MISAKEAREQTIDLISKYDESTLKSIETSIKKAIRKGCFYITVEEYLSINVQNTLRKLGYNVKKQTDVCMSELYICYTISWLEELNNKEN